MRIMKSDGGVFIQNSGQGSFPLSFLLFRPRLKFHTAILRWWMQVYLPTNGGDKGESFDSSLQSNDETKELPVGLVGFGEVKRLEEKRASQKEPPLLLPPFFFCAVEMRFSKAFSFIFFFSFSCSIARVWSTFGG